MDKKVLLVGFEYSGAPLEGVTIETKGLCRRSIEPTKAADALYEYDCIMIYPKSYSHFLFGKATQYSSGDNELWALKRENDKYDLDTLFDYNDRGRELEAAIKNGTKVVWLLTKNSIDKFFGTRSLYIGYLNSEMERIGKLCTIFEKHSSKLRIVKSGPFDSYFDEIKKSGWDICLEDRMETMLANVITPEGYLLGSEIKVEGKKVWILTPPTSEDCISELIKCITSEQEELNTSAYEGIFLSHNSEDKPFARQLRKMFLDCGVENVWIDEAEILVGDSLIKKISEGIDRTTYFGVILSNQSIKSSWVEKELEIAMNYEILAKSVKVLPILFEKCELPPFLIGKLYADFTNADYYEDSLKKLLRRLEKR